MFGWFSRFFSKSRGGDRPIEAGSSEIAAPTRNDAWNVPDAPPAKRKRNLRPRKTRIFVCGVAGESFKNDDGTSRQAIIRRCRPGEGILLEPEPDNPYDQNAIAVRRAASREQIGYLRREVAERLVRDIENDFRAKAIIYDIRGSAGFPKGVWLEVTLECNRGLVNQSASEHFSQRQYSVHRDHFIYGELYIFRRVKLLDYYPVGSAPLQPLYEARRLLTIPFRRNLDDYIIPRAGRQSATDIDQVAAAIDGLHAV